MNFLKKLPDYMPVVSSFQLIATAIDVSARTGVEKNFGIKISDLWALYFWILSSLESGTNRIDTHIIELLKYKPGNPLKENLTDSHKFPSFATFEIDDSSSYDNAIAELILALKNKFLDTKKLDETTFAGECGMLIMDSLSEIFPGKLSKSTEGMTFVAILALRSLLKMSSDLRKVDFLKIRTTGIFWISTFIVTWHFKN